MNSFSTFWLPSLPTFVIHIIVSLVLAQLLWRWLRKSWVSLPASNTVPLVISLTISGYFILNTASTYYQARALMAAANQPKSSPAQGYKLDGLSPGEASKVMLQAKNDFLITVESILANPVQLTAESKDGLFKQFEILFPHGAQDREAYRLELSEVYNCQAAFYQDAIAALKAKKPVKSTTREECQKKQGRFFNRELLITEEVAKANDSTIASLASGKKILQNGQEIKVDEAFLQQNLESQLKNLEVLKVLFQ